MFYVYQIEARGDTQLIQQNIQVYRNFSQIQTHFNSNNFRISKLYRGELEILVRIEIFSNEEWKKSLQCQWINLSNFEKREGMVVISP